MAEKKDHESKIVSLWTMSLILGVLFFVFYSVNTYFNWAEDSIRRESYVASLQQVYDQEVQNCLTQGATGAEGTSNNNDNGKNAVQTCLDKLNKENKYAKLLKKWAGSDSLTTEAAN